MMHTADAARRAEGEARKQEVLVLLAARRGVYVNRGRRVLLSVMLAGNGAGTADHVREAVELPADRAAAERWLQDHPDRPDPGAEDQDGPAVQGVLFPLDPANEPTPAGSTAGAGD